MNIYQRINEVRKKVSYVQKDSQIGNYKAVSHDQVTAHLRAAMLECGVVIVPSLIESSFGAIEGAKWSMYQAKYDIKYINIDDPNDFFSMIIESQALDNGDKATGKAISYAVKNSMLKVFSLETGVDDEGRQEEIKQKQEAKETLTQEQAATIKEMTEKAQADLSKFLLFFKVNKLEEMKQSDYVKAFHMLETKIKGDKK